MMTELRRFRVRGYEGCAFQTQIYGTFKSHKNRKHNPHSLSDFKAGVVKVTVQSASPDDGPTSSADIDDSLSDVDIDALVEELHYLLSTVSVPITCSSLSDFFKNKNIEVDGVVVNELADLLCKSNPLVNALVKSGALATAYKRKEYFKKVLNIIEPVEYVLDQKKSRSFQYIPILRSLQQILDSICVLTQGSNTDQLENQQYRSIRDGVYFKENPFLSSDELKLCLTLYIDDLNCVIPWRDDVKAYGYGKILEPLLHDLVTLEEHGVFIPKLGTFVKGTVHSVIADNLGAHGLAGFIESFSGQYICRFCTAQKVKIQSKDVHSGAFSLRTKEIHDAHLKIAQDTETSCFGVKRACPLTEYLQHVHVSTGYPPDLVHDLFEGIVPFELALCLSILISKKYFSFDSLNTRILKFPYKWSDKKNRPHIIPHNYSSRKTIGGNAHENWCLIHLIPEGELAWQVILDLKEIAELVVAPVHTHETIAYLDVKVSEHRHRLLELIPGEKLKPKHHYLEHYSHLIRCFGPLVDVWTIRFEAKHASNVEVKNVSIVPGDVLNEEVVLAVRQKYPDISQVNLTKNCTTRGINYRNGMILACGSTAGMPEFAEILQIYIVRDELSFIVCLYFAWYQDHFRAFQLTLSPGREVALVQLEELTDCYLLVAYTVGSRRMVTLKRHIVIRGLILIIYSAV
ncbi:hypothetical protein N1851_030882 [Merluccius polli]|uniref:Uncharacterized protein n=1 Tax=Merluccius polli TaxID=89951 RepID=A0AA47M4P8_MERPO|nr:hypothetical protein N1851_030882 [Merluccius polli]